MLRGGDLDIDEEGEGNTISPIDGVWIKGEEGRYMGLLSLLLLLELFSNGEKREAKVESSDPR